MDDLTNIVALLLQLGLPGALLVLVVTWTRRLDTGYTRALERADIDRKYSHDRWRDAEERLLVERQRTSRLERQIRELGQVPVD